MNLRDATELNELFEKRLNELTPKELVVSKEAIANIVVAYRNIDESVTECYSILDIEMYKWISRRFGSIFYVEWL